MIRMNRLRPMRRLQCINEILKKFPTKPFNMRLGVFTNKHHLSNMRLALNMTFESIFVGALFFTGLTVPSNHNFVSIVIF